MSASKKIKSVLLEKDMKVGDLAKELGMSQPALSTKLTRDTMSFAAVENIADILGCDVVLKDRETGKEF